MQLSTTTFCTEKVTRVGAVLKYDTIKCYYYTWLLIYYYHLMFESGPKVSNKIQQDTYDNMYLIVLNI